MIILQMIIELEERDKYKLIVEQLKDYLMNTWLTGICLIMTIFS